jgi:hypothetical protein
MSLMTKVIMAQIGYLQKVMWKLWQIHPHLINKTRLQYLGLRGLMDFRLVILTNKGNNKITELRTILQRESQNS